MAPLFVWLWWTLLRVPGPAPVATVERPVGTEMFQVGEELEYRVSYSFFRIGTIRVAVEGSENRGGRTVYKTRTWIDSNPSLSWLANVHIRFYGEMDGEAYSYRWVGDDSSSKGVEFRTMEFDYTNRRMYYAKGARTPDEKVSIVERDTVPINGPSQDGLSLLFYARANGMRSSPVRVATFIDTAQAHTDINFRGKKEEIEIDAVDYPVQTVYFDGAANFVGVFGLTGGFEGWFSDDDAHIPIVARMKVILGSVKVELVSWKRQGWTPPRSN